MRYTEARRVVLLTDDEIERVLAWYEHLEVEADCDEDDDDLAEKLKGMRLK